MHLIIEHKVRRPYASTVFVADGIPTPTLVVEMWMAHLSDDDDYDDSTFIITPDPADARSAGREDMIGAIELMRIDEIRSILIMEREV